MKIQSFLSTLVAAVIVLSITGCQKGDLLSNPNAGLQSTIPVTLIMNHLTATLIRDEEFPFATDCKYNQYQVSNDSKYWSTNEYSWSYSPHSYDILKYAIQLENQAKTLYGANSKYAAVGKFFRAYSAIWLSQRVGDIPMTQAGTDSITPSFDAQKEVYKKSLALLDTANTIMGSLFGNATVQNTAFDGGDIFNLTNLQWQKLINTYKLRVLISLSKRADDNSDLAIKSQFITILTNTTKYPIMTSNSDNLFYGYNATNQQPIYQNTNTSYLDRMNVGKTILDITTTNKDPRTFLFATPAPALIAGGSAKPISDFNAYVGADSKLSLSAINSASGGGNLSYFNALRYLSSNIGANSEVFIFVGYPEMCFNIAEAINRGWGAPTLNAADAKVWYDNGVLASYRHFFKNNSFTFASTAPITISTVGGGSLGTVTPDYTSFLTNISYNVANPSTALTQILQQKYVAMFMNSGLESFFNARRTNVPAFTFGGPGIGTGAAGLIPKRWLYPIDEINFNNSNYLTSIQSQYAGSDDVNLSMWSIK